VGFYETVSEMSVRTSYRFNGVLALLGAGLAIAAAFSIRDDAVPGWIGVIGGVLIVVGAAIAELRRRQRGAPHSSSR
jgi:hypothetical protein